MFPQFASGGPSNLWVKVSLGTRAKNRVLRGGIPIKRKPDNARFASNLKAIAENRDRKAFEELFSYFAPRIKTYLLGLKIPPAQIDDLIQEVFLTVWRKAKLYNPEKAFVSTWIFTIARNKFIDGKRKEGRFPADDLTFLEGNREVETGEAAFEERETQARIHSALKTLPKDQSEVIRKAFLEGKTHSEVAGEIGLPLGTVKSRIRLAFEKMRNQLET